MNIIQDIGNMIDPAKKIKNFGTKIKKTSNEKWKQRSHYRNPYFHPYNQGLCVFNR